MEMVTLPRPAYQALRAALPAATKLGLRETFGVSETTWRKLRLGQPIRRSTYERLMARYRGLPARLEIGAIDGGPSL